MPLTDDQGCAGRVVVVDDEPGVVEVAAAVLESVGFEVERADNALACLAAFDRGPVDAVLTDVCMDGMDGFELLEAIGERNDTTRTVIMTAHDSYDMVRTALEAGAYDYLDKPLDRHDLIVSKVARAVEAARLLGRNTMLLGELALRTEELERVNGKLRVMNRRLQVLANTDALTRLYNRRFLDHNLERELRRCQRYDEPLTIALIDIDHFKRFNDSFGHAAGDEALRRVASLLRESARRTDIVGRYGGEEFLAILTGTSAETATVFAERLRTAVAGAQVLDDPGAPRLSLSVGLADRSVLEATSTPADLLAAADAALYRAKDAGRDQVVIADRPAAVSPRAA